MTRLFLLLKRIVLLLLIVITLIVFITVYLDVSIPTCIVIVTAISGLFKEAIYQLIMGPKIIIKLFPLDKRDCHATKFHDRLEDRIVSAPVHYFRLRVENVGQSVAEKVAVMIEEVRTLRNTDFEIDQDFMPLQLLWSHWREKRFELDIPPKTFRHCDLGFIVDPKSQYQPLPAMDKDKLVFWLDVWPRPNTGRTSLLPGQYKITITASGKNANKATKILNMDWKGQWSPQIEQLLEESLLFK